MMQPTLSAYSLAPMPARMQGLPMSLAYCVPIKFLEQPIKAALTELD